MKSKFLLIIWLFGAITAIVEKTDKVTTLGRNKETPVGRTLETITF